MDELFARYLLGLPALLITPLAMLLLLRGFRGRWITHSPLCRRCGFDQTGRPHTSSRCAECGADLLAPRAIRLGRRRWRYGLIATGLLLICLTVALLHPSTLNRLVTTDWQPFKPVWWLKRDILSDDRETQNRAERELHRRYEAGQLPLDDRKALKRLALQRQVDTDKPWWYELGDWIEIAHAENRLTSVEVDQYIRQSHPTLDFSNRSGGRIVKSVRGGFSSYESMNVRTGLTRHWRPIIALARGSRIVELDNTPITPRLPTLSVRDFVSGDLFGVHFDFPKDLPLGPAPRARS